MTGSVVVVEAFEVLGAKLGLFVGQRGNFVIGLGCVLDEWSVVAFAGLDLWFIR